MTTPETPPASEAPSSAHAQSPRKRGMIIAVALFLTLVATAFTLASVLTATAAPALTSNQVSNLTSAPCPGDKPGICPGSSFAQPH